VRLLIVMTQCPVPSDSGPKNVSAGLLRAAARIADSDVLCFYDSNEEHDAWRDLPKVIGPVRIVAAFPTQRGPRRTTLRLRNVMLGRSPASAKYRSRVVQRWLRDNAARYDVVVFDNFNLCDYAPGIRPVPTVLIPYDAFSLGALRSADLSSSILDSLAAWWRRSMFSRVERRSYHLFTVVCPVARLDQTWLETFAGVRRTAIMPVEVSPEILRLGEARFDAVAGRGIIRVSIVGDAGLPDVFRDLVDAAHVVSDLLGHLDDIEVVVWSRRRTSDLRCRCPRVEVAGLVEDYVDRLLRTDICVYPQRGGSGVQTKLQEHMAAGVACIGTSSVMGPLHVVHGINGMIADTPDELRSCLLALVRDERYRRSVGVHAHRNVRLSTGEDSVRKWLLDLCAEARYPEDSSQPYAL